MDIHLLAQALELLPCAALFRRYHHSMCYSGMAQQDLKKLGRKFQAQPDLAAFEQVFQLRLDDPRMYFPKALEANFRPLGSPQERRIYELIQEYRSRRRAQLQADLDKQKLRLAQSVDKLAQKETKSAREHQRIAARKIETLTGALIDLDSPLLEPEHSRIFPGWYAPVVMQVQGERLIKPMRYLLRPAAAAASHDRELPGCYNARRDNLKKFWRAQFGHTHGIVVMTAFYEHVSRHKFERRELAPGEAEESVILHFNPQPAFEMNVACLWSHWERPGQPPLDSFAAITDEPPAEVAAAGHDRCIIPLKEANVQAWLTPEQQPVEQSFDLLDDRERPYYEHRLAA